MPLAKQDLIRRRKLYEEVVERLLAMLRAGELAPGDQLPSERELMQAFGVGRPAVREALLTLQRMGLLAVSSGERARVVQPTPSALFDELSGMAGYILASKDGVRHFQEARLFFECSLARHAALHASEDDIRKLERALLANEAALGDLERAVRTDVAFHYAIAEIPRNPIFVSLHRALLGWLTEQRTTSLGHPVALRAACAAHRRIFEAIQAGDADGAEAAMRDHLQEVARYYWTARETVPEGGHG
jgi:GntR family transcriptional regulator, sialic acid-inducible nan operon repressor